MIRRTIGLCVLGGFCGFVAAVGQAILSAAPPEVAPAPKQPASPYTGAIGCAAAACHNAGGHDGRPGNEYSTWAKDPHAKAYSVLLNEQSQNISRNLRRATPAYKDALCLACHATPAPSDDPGAVASGVGCESCHGPARDWRAIHYQPGWKTLSTAEKAKYGMADTKDLVARAQKCVECHVGTPNQEVNHDLIAAGHPRLAFEFAGYLGAYPHKHWRRDQEPFGDQFEARAWEIGQLVSARAAAELLRSRAEKASVWPELAEYGCFGCHHDLKEDASAWRRTRRFADLSVGSLPWGAWYFALNEKSPLFGNSSADLSALTKLMAQPNPPQSEVAAAATRVRDALDVALKSAATAPALLNPAILEERIRRLANDGQNPEIVGDWEHAAQRYLAIAAHAQCLGDMKKLERTPDRRAALLALRDQLAFPDSPRRFDSPAAFSLDHYRKLINDINRSYAPTR